MVSLSILLASSPSLTFIMTFCLYFVEVGPTMKADRVVRMDRVSVMEALRRKKSRSSSDAAPSPKRLRLSKASTMTKKRKEAGSR